MSHVLSTDLSYTCFSGPQNRVLMYFEALFKEGSRIKGQEISEDFLLFLKYCKGRNL